MRLNKTDKFIEDYCLTHGIHIFIDPAIKKDDGLCYPEIKHIHLAKNYSNNSVKLAIFLHECGHLYVERFKNLPYNSFECEFLSWVQAVKLHRKYFSKSFNKAQANTMLKCLLTYGKYDSEFRKTSVQ